VPATVGGLVFTGAVAVEPELTTAVALDSAVAEPALFDPVTATRIVAPTSAADSE
jgi:hypothetical protein